jgi:hypothetical protein
MTAQEIQTRNEKAQQLRVLQTDDGSTFFVESSDSKIAYRVECNDDHYSCTCGDYTRGLKKDENFVCKHIMAVISSTSNREQVALSGKLAFRNQKPDGSEQGGKGKGQKFSAWKKGTELFFR